MPPRVSIPPAVQQSVLIKSRRACALCFGFRKDSSQKKGQLAHVDRDRGHNDEDNIAYLCIEHHDEYDTDPRQTKKLTEGELRHYRDALYRHLGTYQPSDKQLDQVRDLARRMPEVSQRHAEAIIVELQQIFANTSEHAVAEEALFRVTLAELPSSVGWLLSIADDVERPFVLRQRAMIGLCSILRHDHPSAGDDGQGAWLRWWTEGRNSFVAKVNAISRI